MRISERWALSLALGLALTACGVKTNTQAAADAMKAGNFALAESDLDALLKAQPDAKPVHAFRMVLFRYLSVQGGAEKQAAYLQKAIDEYDALVKLLGLKPDYSDMEGSLRSNPEGAQLVAAARKPLYGE